MLTTDTDRSVQIAYYILAEDITWWPKPRYVECYIPVKDDGTWRLDNAFPNCNDPLVRVSC